MEMNERNIETKNGLICANKMSDNNNNNKNS